MLSLIQTQDRLLYLSFYMLLNLAEDVGVERKMKQKASAGNSMHTCLLDRAHPCPGKARGREPPGCSTGCHTRGCDNCVASKSGLYIFACAMLLERVMHRLPLVMRHGLGQTCTCHETGAVVPAMMHGFGHSFCSCHEAWLWPQLLR